MKKMSVVTTVGLYAVTLTVTLAGCNATKTESKSAESSTTTSSAAASSTLAVPDMPTGPNKTIADYIDDDDVFDNQTPEWAYGAIVYQNPVNPEDPPFVLAIISKLTGDVDPAKILEFAPGLLQNLPGYEQDGDVEKTTLSGFDGVEFQASYLKGEERRYIAQATVVIPGKDGAIFVLQLNADAPKDQGQVVRDAATVINAETKITV